MEYKFKVWEHAASTEDQNMIISSFSRVFSWQYMYVPDWKYRKATEISPPLFPLQLSDFLFVYVWIMLILRKNKTKTHIYTLNNSGGPF